MNRNQGQGNPAPPFPIVGNRFSRPWLSTRNPLHQVMPGASQMSTGGSYGTAARARGGLPMNRPAGAPSSQQAPVAPPPVPFHFTAPWSQTQPSQPEYDQHQGFQIPSGADNSQQAAYGGAGGGFLEPLAHSQPSHTAARLLEELQGRSAPAPTPTPAIEKEDTLPLLKEILEKLEACEKKQTTMQSSLEALETQLQAQATSLEPSVEIMNQAFSFIKATTAKHEKILNEIAVQTSPSLIKLAPIPPPENPAQYLRGAQVTPAQRVAPVQPPQLFSALVAEPSVRGKRPRQYETEEDDDTEEDEVSSRLARRVQRHRRMMAQSKALASER